MDFATPDDDDSNAAGTQRKSLAQRQRKRLQKMQKMQREQDKDDGNGQGSSSKKGEGSKEKHDANGQGSSSKKGEGSKKRQKEPQSPPNGAASEYQDDEADEESHTGRNSPLAHNFGSGAARGRISAALSGTTTQRALFKDGELCEHGVIRYDPNTGLIPSRSPSPRTPRQKDMKRKRDSDKKHEEWKRRQPSPEY